MVRKRILDILKRRKQATVEELARQLDMAPVSVRYHLDILQGENLIEVGKIQREGSVGRPKQVYMLTGEAADYFPDNFAGLTSGLLRQMKSLLPAEQVQSAFCCLAQEMSRELIGGLAVNESLALVIVSAIINRIVHICVVIVSANCPKFEGNGTEIARIPSGNGEFTQPIPTVWPKR